MRTQLAPVRVVVLLFTASSLRAAVIVTPQAPVALTPMAGLPSATIGTQGPALSLPTPSLAPSLVPAAPASLPPVPLALQAAPLLAASVDSKKPVEANAAAGEDLVALLQGARDPLKRVTAEEIVPGVVHFRFPTQRLLASTFVRFQEHYESPKFRNKVFTLAEFKEWYKTTKEHGNFSYYEDWDGFNIPSRVLRKFKNGEFGKLSAKERALLERVARRKGRFYMIGTAAQDADKGVLRHETAHGLWYTRPDYRRRAKAILKDLDLGPVFEMLEGLGYHRSVWMDEAHAWIGDGAEALEDAGLKDPRPYREAERKLLALQKEYAPGLF